MREPTLRIFPIVEGHGEEAAIRGLLMRVGLEVLGLPFIEVLRPLRRPKTLLLKEKELARAVKLATLKLAQGGSEGDLPLVLILVDADDDLPCQLAPRWLEIASGEAPIDVACVVANPEYETWFVAAAESLGNYLELGDNLPKDPELERAKKAWIEKRFKGPKYSETIDQPRMTAAMDLQLCRSQAPSFDKLCRDLERLADQLPGRRL